jgi:hypothetical protein
MNRPVRDALALACLACPAAAAPAAPPSDFEVLVVGTGHAPTMFLSPEYTPAHLRAVLDAAAPDVVAVESHPEWFAHGRFHVVTYEAQGVAVPWARERGVPAVGVDWKDVDDWDRLEQLGALAETRRLEPWAASEAAWPLAAFSLGSSRFDPSSLGSYDLRHINSEEYGRSRHARLEPEDPNFAARRDRGIAANCVAAMEAHPGGRLVVVVGAHHKPFLDVLLARVEGVRVLQLGRDLPWPGAGDVDAAWTAQHLVVTLGWLLDGRATYGRRLPAQHLARAEELVGRLGALGGSALEARYFRARLDAARGRAAEAAASLDALLTEAAAGADCDLHPFPMRWWRMRYTFEESLLLERAALHLAEEDDAGRAAAEGLLATVERGARFRLRTLERTSPRETRSLDGIDDPGFELGARAPDFFSGWYAYLPTGQGALRWEGDEDQRVEGARSLRLTIEEAHPTGWGFVVRQECRVPVALAGRTFEFELALRSEGLESATLQAGHSFASNVHEAITAQDFALTDGAWSRAHVVLTIPESGEFSLRVHFRGPAGARVWLDGGTPLPARYVTIPREWSRARLALAFPAALLGAGSFPAAEVAPVDPPAAAPAQEPFGLPGGTAVLRDGGFEAGTLARTPDTGWFCGDGEEVVTWRPDNAVRVEGARCLRAQLAAATNAAGGRPGLLQIVPALAGPHTFKLRVRADGPGEVLLTAGTWDEDRTFRELARSSHALEAIAWVEASLALSPSIDAGAVGLFVYLPQVAGRSVWLDAATLQAD